MELASIHIYPVKSCAGISLGEATLDELGLAHDRRFMVVQRDGSFVTQRDVPRMALVQTALEATTLRLELDGSTLRLPLTPAAGAPLPVTIWGEDVVARHVSGEADAWFAAALGLDVQLAYMPTSTIRPVDPTYADGAHTGFADGFPLLVVGEASLADLNARLDTAVPMDRFRPNLVVRGSAAFAEDAWKEIAVGQVALRIVKPCARCVIVTTDQRTAVRDPEPLSVLAGYRRRGNGAMFGQNAIHLGHGTLRVGDSVEQRL